MLTPALRIDKLRHEFVTGGLLEVGGESSVELPTESNYSVTRRLSDLPFNECWGN